MNPLSTCLFAIALSALLHAQEESKAERAAKTWTVRGRAVDETGKPIAGACLQVGSEDQVTTAATLAVPLVRSNADGNFEASVTVVDDPYVRRAILLAAPGRLAAVLTGNSFVAAFASGDRTMDVGCVPLAPAVTLRGVVRQRGGQALAGARVSAADAIQALVSEEWSRSGASYTSVAVTDDKGQFTLPGVAPTGARIEVRAEGFCEQELPFVSPGDPLVIELEESGFVEGEVLDLAGKPADAWVYVQTDAGEGARPQRATNGKFRISLPRHETYCVSAMLFESRADATREPMTGPKQGIVLRPVEPTSPRGTLVLRVTDAATGKAVEDIAAAAVWIESEGRFQQEHLQYQFERRVVRGKQPGELRLPAPGEGEPDQGVVMVEAKGYASQTLPGVRWSDDAPVVLEAKLVREAVVTGVVVEEATGKPVAGAMLRLGAAPEVDSPWVPGISEADVEPGNRVTDDQGRFRIGSLPAGKQRLCAHLWPRPMSAAVELELQAGETRASVQLVIPKGVTIAGRLVGVEAAPFAVLQLRRKPTAPIGWSSFSNDITTERTPVGADGRFRFEGLGRGDYELELTVPHRQGRGGWMTFPVEPIRVRRVDLQRDCDASECVPGVVRGKVSVSGMALPPGRMAVVLHAIGEREHHHGRERPMLCDPVTGDSFTLPAPAGTYRVELLDLATSVPLAVKDKVRVEPGTPVAVELSVELVSVRVILKPEKGARLDAGSLQVVVEREGSGEEQRDDGATIPLGAGVTELDLFLPRLPVKIEVHGARYTLEGRGWHSRESALAERSLVPEPGKTDRIEIVVPKAPAEGEGR